MPTAGSSETPAVPGSDVELTIDRDIQWAAQSAITEQVKKSEADRGYVIVQDTRTGEVLAMANAPGFDPNDLSQGRRRRAWATRPSRTPTSPAPPPRSCRWPPCWRRSAATPDTHVTVPNRLHRGDRLFKDDIDHPTWYLTLNGVLAKSSNIGTILATGQLGKTQAEANQVLYSYLRKFGIGSPPGSASPARPRASSPSPQDWSTSQQYTIPFGQGLSLNAMQAASVYSTIANGGVRIAAHPGPRHQGRRRPLHRRRPAPERPGSSARRPPRPWPQMLESVVDDEEGTGTKARIPGYRVAGKTGTANRVDPATGRYHGYTASFAGFAPADKPRDHRLLRHPEPHQGQLLRRPDLRPDLQAGHGVRPEDPPGRRRPAAKPARLPGDLRPRPSEPGRRRTDPLTTEHPRNHP